MTLVNSTTDTQKPMPRDRTDRAWFSRLLWHPARKQSGSILTIPEPARGYTSHSWHYIQFRIVPWTEILRAVIKQNGKRSSLYCTECHPNYVLHQVRFWQTDVQNSHQHHGTTSLPLRRWCCHLCLSVCLSACLPVCVSVCLYACLSVCLSVCLSACLPVCLPACLSVCLLTGSLRNYWSNLL